MFDVIVRGAIRAHGLRLVAMTAEMGWPECPIEYPMVILFTRYGRVVADCGRLASASSELVYQGGAWGTLAPARSEHTRPHFRRYGMSTAPRKTELSPLEAIVVEGTLGDEARRNAQNGALARIQQLTRERQKLYARSVGRPMLGPANAARIRSISVEIEMLWELLRRERAARRVQIERALNVVNEGGDDNDDQRASNSSSGNPTGSSDSTDAA